MRDDTIIKQFKTAILSYIMIGKITDEIEINSTIQMHYEFPIYKENLTLEDVETVKKQIHSECSITLDSGISLIAKEHVKWFKNRKYDLKMSYWNRYKDYLLIDKKFPNSVINTMDDVSDELTDLLGDPNSNMHFQRRGLVIGDVQSGKTANYTGLICKAADAGYDVVVLLTGTIENLRKQTQTRLDEGFMGLDSLAMLKKKENAYIGVGNRDRTLNPMTLTSTSFDFKAANASNLGFTLNSVSGPVLFVIKKNVAVLDRLSNWLKTFNLNGNKKINKSLIMVDDEADNASINTNPEDKDPTKTNEKIRDILGLFTKASYVGFTATPFANIFIDPETDEDMKTEDLFPKDYIYSLNAPSNYIGARNIFSEDAKYHNMLRIIDDAETYFPLSHKIDFNIIELSPSLIQALNSFFLTNTIRDLRGDITSHRSMIINASRFVRVQGRLKEIVNDYLKLAQDATKLYSKLPIGKALEDETIKSIYNTFMRMHSNTEFSWETIQDNIAKSISTIETFVVNTSSSGLNYSENEQNGLRAIAIGGLSLSRGLTLEGLCTSYFYRNSKMYDTLMQMGRWFGYRKNYEDLCTIWMNEENMTWYTHINESTDELRREVKRMKDLGLTPIDFGLKVRSHSDTLLVTARNKMRTSKEITRNISLSGEYIETPRIYDDANKNKQNLGAVEEMLNALKEFEATKQGTVVGYKNVKKDIIIDLLKNIEVSYANTKFDSKAISDFINNYNENELNNWDIVFLNGESKELTYRVTEDLKINLIERSYDLRNDNTIQISGSKNRLGAAQDSKFGLNMEQLDKTKTQFLEENSGKEVTSTIPQSYYFQSNINRNPLLHIYLIDLKLRDDTGNIKEKFNGDPLVGFGIGIPPLIDKKTSYVHYRINKIAAELGDYDIGDEE